MCTVPADHRPIPTTAKPYPPASSATSPRGVSHGFHPTTTITPRASTANTFAFLPVMERIPPEVWATIFRLACVDGGTTGCSLALVSSHIREVSAPYRLRSVSLHGPAKIQSFLTSLERTPTHLRCVRNIFISTQRRGNADAKICWEYLSQRLSGTRVKPEDIKAMAAILERKDMLSITGTSSALKFRKIFQFGVKIWEAHTAPLALHMAQAIDAILVMVAPTLNILELDINPTVSDYLQSVTDFPCLQELTSHGGYPLMRHAPHNHLIHYCPSLRRLHLRHSYKHHRISNSTIIARIGTFAPHLTHVFFSNLTSSDPWVRDVRLHDLPKAVKHTFLNYAYNNESGSERDQGPVVTQMKMNDRSEQNRVILLPDQQNGCDYGSNFFCWPVSDGQWLSRISGHVGCWLDEEESDVE